MFLNKCLGFSVNCLLQLLSSHHFLHFKVGIFNANVAEQPNQASGTFQGIVGVGAASALLGSATGLAPGEILSPAAGSEVKILSGICSRRCSDEAMR